MNNYGINNIAYLPQPNLLLDLPINTRVEIWNYLKISDFGAILSLCRQSHYNMESDLKLIAKTLFQSDFKDASLNQLITVLKVNISFNNFFLESFHIHSEIRPYSLMGLNNQVNQLIGYDETIRNFCQLNHIDLIGPPPLFQINARIKIAFLAYFSPELKDLSLNSNGEMNILSFTDEEKIDFPSEILTTWNDIFEINELLVEFTKNNLDIARFLESFSFPRDLTSSIKYKVLFQISTAIKFFNTTLDQLRVFQKNTPSTFDVFLHNIHNVYKLLKYANKSISLDTFLKIGNGPLRYRISVNAGPISALIEKKLLLFENIPLIESKIAKFFVGDMSLFTDLFKELNEENLLIIRENPDILHGFFTHLKVFQNLKYLDQFFILKLLEMDKSNIELFLKNAKSIFKLFSFKLFTTKDFFDSKNIPYRNKIIENALSLLDLAYHWSFSEKKINLFTEFLNDPTILDYILTNALALIHHSKFGQRGFKAFVKDFSTLSIEILTKPVNKSYKYSRQEKRIIHKSHIHKLSAQPINLSKNLSVIPSQKNLRPPLLDTFDSQIIIARPFVNGYPSPNFEYSPNLSFPKMTSTANTATTETRVNLTLITMIQDMDSNDRELPSILVNPLNSPSLSTSLQTIPHPNSILPKSLSTNSITDLDYIPPNSKKSGKKRKRSTPSFPVLISRESTPTISPTLSSSPQIQSRPNSTSYSRSIYNSPLFEFDNIPIDLSSKKRKETTTPSLSETLTMPANTYQETLDFDSLFYIDSKENLSEIIKEIDTELNLFNINTFNEDFLKNK